jgi:hypothetical protein
MTVLQRPLPKPAQGVVRWVRRPQEGFAVLAINDKLYGLIPLGVGYRLVQGDGTIYDVLDRGEEPWECDCPDYIFRRANVDPRGCKHVLAVRAALRALANEEELSPRKAS